MVYFVTTDLFPSDVSREDGKIMVKSPLTNSPSSVSKRDVSHLRSQRLRRDNSLDAGTAGLVRSKREISSDENLSIKAWSGQAGSRSTTVDVTIAIPGTPGTNVPSTQGETVILHLYTT